MFPQLSEAFDHSVPDVINFVGVCILVLGFSNFIWVPISETLGRRSVLLTSTAISFGSSIWRAKAQTYGSFMGASVLNGISSGPGEVSNVWAFLVRLLIIRRPFNQRCWLTYSFSTIGASRTPYTSPFISRRSWWDPSFLGPWRNTLAGGTSGG